MNLESALEAALNGDALLFTGAGFSAGATNLLGKPFLRGQELAELLSKSVGMPKDTPLNEAADIYLDDIGPDKLIELLQSQFTAQEIAKYHRLLLRAPWRKVYTTNYDNIIEKACEAEGIRCTSVTPSIDIRDIPKDHLLCVHLNGSVNNLSREALQSELKLTDSSI